MATTSQDKSAASRSYGARRVHAVRNKYFNSCYNKLAHQDSITALEHARDISRKHPQKKFSIYVCDFCACLHVGRGDHVLSEEADV